MPIRILSAHFDLIYYPQFEYLRWAVPTLAADRWNCQVWDVFSLTLHLPTRRWTVVLCLAGTAVDKLVKIWLLPLASDWT